MDTLPAPEGLLAAAVLLLLAGLADALGTRAVPLLINRITPRAFVVTLLASALLSLAGAAMWIGGAWLAATQVFGVEGTLKEFFVVLSLAYAPFLFGALTLLPLVGPVLRWGLRLWSFLLGLSLLVVLGLNVWQALLCAACGTLLVLGINWLFGEPAAFVARRAWATLAGHPRPLHSHLPRVIPGYAPDSTADTGPRFIPSSAPGSGAASGGSEQAPR
jgi:hypothetical protein